MQKAAHKRPRQNGALLVFVLLNALLSSGEGQFNTTNGV